MLIRGKDKPKTVLVLALAVPAGERHLNSVQLPPTVLRTRHGCPTCLTNRVFLERPFATPEHCRAARLPAYRMGATTHRQSANGTSSVEEDCHHAACQRGTVFATRIGSPQRRPRRHHGARPRGAMFSVPSGTSHRLARLAGVGTSPYLDKPGSGGRKLGDGTRSGVEHGCTQTSCVVAR